MKRREERGSDSRVSFVIPIAYSYAMPRVNVLSICCNEVTVVTLSQTLPPEARRYTVYAILLPESRGGGLHVILTPLLILPLEEYVPFVAVTFCPRPIVKPVPEFFSILAAPVNFTALFSCMV